MARNTAEKLDDHHTGVAQPGDCRQVLTTLADESVQCVVTSPPYFGGAGTTGLVCERLERNSILIELNPAFAAMSDTRIRADAPLFVEGT
jgi:DNA modification methylase